MRDPYFPFHALGFCSNPFRALTNEEWANIVVIRQTVIEAANGGHLQILGELGRGKTSTLLGLGQLFRRQGRRLAYEYLPIGQRAFTSSLAGLDIFLLDEAQRLRPDERRRLLAAAGDSQLRLILGSQEDLTPVFNRAGYSLASVRLDRVAPADLASILARRLEADAITACGAGVTRDLSALAYLEATFGANLRSMEHFLYEVFQRLEAPGVITAEQLKAIAASQPK